MIHIPVIIVDDEAGACEVLGRLINTYCKQLEIKAVCRSVDEATVAIERFRPSIVFLDINMPVKDGFDLLRQTHSSPFKTIFTTAYNQFAIQAIRFSAMDYLLKPLDIDQLVSAVKKTETALAVRHDQLSLLERYMQHTGLKPEKIILASAHEHFVVNIADIVRAEAVVNGVTFHLADREEINVPKPLKYYEGLLSECGFFRIHQSHLINLLQVKRYIKTENARIIMNDDTEVAVARNKKAEFTEAFMQRMLF
ncbi:MAG: LytTR family DNA-binding domain-containing protein [Bacteroidota bacterium]